MQTNWQQTSANPKGGFSGSSFCQEWICSAGFDLKSQSRGLCHQVSLLGIVTSSLAVVISTVHVV